MLDKYFDFKKIQDESSVLESLLEHTRIDEEEVGLLKKMIQALCEKDTPAIEDFYGKITLISDDSNRIFENTMDHIVQADFDHQKKYDLLRLYQRIERISDRIISTAKRVLILNRMGDLDDSLAGPLQLMMTDVSKTHDLFKVTLINFQTNKKDTLKSIHHTVEMHHKVDVQRIEAISRLYEMGNSDSLSIGTFRAIENTIEYVKDLSDSISEAATSVEWLLI